MIRIEISVFRDLGLRGAAEVHCYENGRFFAAAVCHGVCGVVGAELSVRLVVVFVGMRITT